MDEFDFSGTANRALADSIMTKVKVQLIEGQYLDRLKEKTRAFDELMDRFERKHLVKLASHQTGQVFVKRFRTFFGGRIVAEMTPRLIVDDKSARCRGKDGGRYRYRTCGLFRVKEALYH